MPRRLRESTGGIVYHVLNRGVGRMRLFRGANDYAAFERVVEEAVRRTKTRVLAYCVMPNHWHFVLWPRQDGELSEFMRWLSVTHTQRWHAHRHTSGTGPIYQGRFKSGPRKRGGRGKGVGSRFQRRWWTAAGREGNGGGSHFARG